MGSRVPISLAKSVGPGVEPLIEKKRPQSGPAGLVGMYVCVCIYIYIYIERERERYVYICIAHFPRPSSTSSRPPTILKMAPE